MPLRHLALVAAFALSFGCRKPPRGGEAPPPSATTEQPAAKGEPTVAEQGSPIHRRVIARSS